MMTHWGSEALWLDWAQAPLVLAGIVVVVYAYARGLAGLRGEHAGTVVGRRQRWCFAGGIATLCLALASPLDVLAHELMSAHMVQHLLLVLAAAPLLAAGRPQLVVPFALPIRMRRRLAGARGSLGAYRGTAALPLPLLAATGLHVAVLWAWHTPSLYELALRNDLLHGAEHATLLGTALALWIPLLRPDRRSRIGHGAGVLCLGALLLAGGVLAALITFAQTPLYESYYTGTGAWGLTALEDQQLAGTIMWVPSGLFYGVAAVLLFLRWLRLVEDQARRHRPGDHDRAATAPSVSHSG